MRVNKQSFSEAFLCFSEAITKDPLRAEIFNWRGKTLMAQGYFMEALMDFSVAIKLEKD